jgi:predicted DNA-binding protein (MmcQ/YjbR family)
VLAGVVSKRDAARIRKVCLALPEVYEKRTWDNATFRVGRDKVLVITDDDGTSASLKADSDELPALLGDPDERYFFPPYVGSKGWIGIHLDHPKADWDDIAELVRTAYVLVAPKKLSRLLEE